MKLTCQVESAHRSVIGYTGYKAAHRSVIGFTGYKAAHRSVIGYTGYKVTRYPKSIKRRVALAIAAMSKE